MGRDRNAFAHVQVSGAGGGKDSSVTQDCILGKVHVFQGVGRHHVGEGLITKARNAVITTASKTDVQKTLRGGSVFCTSVLDAMVIIAFPAFVMSPSPT